MILRKLLTTGALKAPQMRPGPTFPSLTLMSFRARAPSLILFLVAPLSFLSTPTSAQAVTFKTVQECVNHEYDMVTENLCARSNQCNANLCSWVVYTAAP